MDIKKRIFISGSIGNMLEAYDLTICFFFAKILSENFFPANSNNLLNIFYVFLVGLLSKPIGSLVISLFSDQNGRKKVLLVSIVFTGVSTALMGIIPSYQTIGSLALILFFILRILQNIFVGGEYTNSIVYLIENGNEKQGYYGSWAAFGVNLGVLLSSSITFFITLSIHHHFLPAWGWRLAFLPALIAMLIGLWMRTTIPESLNFMLENSHNKSTNSKRELLKKALSFIKQSPSKCMAIAAITWLGVSVTYAVYIYGPIHMTTVNKLSTYQAFSINSISLLILIALIPFLGLLSDILNKVGLLMAASVFFSILALPYFWFISYGSFFQILLMQSIMSLPAACFFSIAPVVIAQAFPIKMRCTSISLIYQTISSVAAGLTPIFILKLIYKTNIPYSPAYFIIAAAIVGYFCLFILRERKPEPDGMILSD